MRDPQMAQALAEIREQSKDTDAPITVALDGVAGKGCEVMAFERGVLTEYEYSLAAHEAWAIEEFRHDHRRADWEELQARRERAQEVSAA